MNYEKLCMSCFKESNGKTCKSCGYAEPDMRSRTMIPARTLLGGRYLIGEVVNLDNVSIEYKALDVQLNRVVEIQEYYPRTIVTRNAEGDILEVNSEDNREIFQKNVMTIKNNALKMTEFSNSPYIVNVYDSFESNNTVYVVKEYIEGVLLGDFIKTSGGRLDINTALSIINPVLEGLSQIHKAGLVHRDLTPKSIILTANNEIKISEFRFLKEASPYKDENMTIHFSSGYAPPEQYRTKSKQGPFTDIYSAGAVLYRMITGKKPVEAISRLNEDDIVPPEDFIPEIPDYISISIMKALNVTAELRFKSASDFKNCLINKKDVVDVDEEIKNIKTKKYLRTTRIILLVLAIIVLFIMYKLME